MFIDIDFIKKSVYLHLTDLIKIWSEKTVSMRGALQRKMGFRS
jgi:hypothetical protein